jgi:diguanylate cyclase (GGDEF)-like protein/PAS domain S-box-containing protein
MKEVETFKKKIPGLGDSIIDLLVRIAMQAIAFALIFEYVVSEIIPKVTSIQSHALGLLVGFLYISRVAYKEQSLQQKIFSEKAEEIKKREQVEKSNVHLSHQMELILTSTAEGILGLDLDGRHTFVNPAALTMLQYNKEELLGLNGHDIWYHERRNEEDCHKEACPICATYTHGKATRTSSEVFWRKDGTNFPVEYLSTPMYDDGKVVGAVVTFIDITERKLADTLLYESERKYRELSITDDLTKLFNVRHFYDQVNLEIVRVNRYKQTLSIMMADIDDFKIFNDKYGHQDGNEVLARFGQLVKKCLRETDTSYRYGGEEFVVILPITAREKAVIVAEKIRTEFKRQLFFTSTRELVNVTLSIGVTEYEPLETTEAFIQRADKLMYQAKKSGKDRVCW